ncbi:MAG: hypothetical protein WDZ49_12375 [Litorilinea sp.]
MANQTLLGIRFWDRLLARPVTEGLAVRAQRVREDRARRLGRSVVGRPTPGGTIAFFGLHSGERVEADPATQIWSMVPAQQWVAVDVVDTLRRYLPLSFVVRVPLDHPGAFRGQAAWLDTPLVRPIPPPADDGAANALGVSLWTAPSRPLPGTYILLLAQIVVGTTADPPPAAYALVEVTQPASGTLVHFGMTDMNGTLLLPLPYPSVPDPPPDVDYAVLQRQTFPLTISIRFRADARPVLPDSEVPELESLLSQPPAQIGTHHSGTPATLATASVLDATVEYGKPLVLRTARGSLNAAETESFLRILPTGS